MKEMNLDAYRFSISWSRLLPNGKLSGGVNKEGIKYYNNLINELQANGLKPFVTLFHWDLPQTLEDEYGGFLNPLIVNHFKDYAELCFKEFGDRVKHWITLNEPWSYSMGGITKGLDRNNFGVTLRLPKFTEEESKLVKGSYDFLGLNYYTANYAAYAPYHNSVNTSYVTDAQASLTTQRNGVPIGPKAASDWLYVYPDGIHENLLYTKRKYYNPLIYITENGIDEFDNPKLTLKQALIDNQRIDYYFRHLSYLQKAIKKGVNVKGYFAWSLLDNFEWNSGFTVRFGINFVDYKNGQKRYPKLSAHWFKKFLKK
ncbi:hypothetical protein TIFTF001_001342 [Ficus carica]|uniref:Beta-glucosidase n=1 Tax=Ficus carica TaxID=3494 RepID=A0AA88CQX3_FICCA|nr:hypothetical protein TIFTF001_001342 [Ficus carica]